jgi:hypothetical protein
VSWTPRRGHFGQHYAFDLIPLVEAHNCIKGCTMAGTEADKGEFGPGGNCGWLAELALGDGTPIEVFTVTRWADNIGDGAVVCSARQDPATVGMEPLFEVTP